MITRVLAFLFVVWFGYMGYNLAKYAEKSYYKLEEERRCNIHYIDASDCKLIGDTQVCNAVTISDKNDPRLRKILEKEKCL